MSKIRSLSEEIKNKSKQFKQEVQHGKHKQRTKSD